MKVIVGAALLGSLAASSAVVVYRKSKSWRFRRFLRKLPHVPQPTVVGWVRNLTLDQGIALRKVLESEELSTEKKLELCELLMEFGQFTRIMKPDYLVRLMLKVEPSAQAKVVEMALRFAEAERTGVKEIVERFDRVNDPALVEILLTGIASIAGAIPPSRNWHANLPSDAERVLVIKQIAYLLAHNEEAVRQVAARLLGSTLKDGLVCAEGIFMELLRDRRREVKMLVAQLVVENQATLRAAMCCVRASLYDLPPSIRARV